MLSIAEESATSVYTICPMLLLLPLLLRLRLLHTPHLINRIRGREAIRCAGKQGGQQRNRPT